MLGGVADRRLGDLVEHHPLDGDARLQRLEEMPGDGLALPVAVGGQIELVDVLEQALELRDGALLIGADDVERFEVRIDVDPEPGPRLRFVLRGHVGCGPRQVTDVAAGGLDDVVGAQVASYFACFSRRLDNDESPHPTVAAAAAVLVSQLCLRSTSMLPSAAGFMRSSLSVAVGN